LTNNVYADIFEEAVGKVLLKNRRVRLIVFDPDTETLLQWI
jgi:hypothetical protein